MTIAIPIIERFWRHVAKADGDQCWNWTGAVTSNGYGSFFIRVDDVSLRKNKVTTPHRWFFQYVNGELPADLHVDHLCRNRLCVRPDHLEAVTQGENTRRAYAVRTHCAGGHAYDQENTRLDKHGRRHCRACARARDRGRVRTGRREAGQS